MPICKKCHNRFPCKTRISNKIKTLHRRKFCLDCSPFGLHNTKDLTNLRNILNIKCRMCHKIYNYNKLKGHSYDICNSCMVRERKNERKLWALEYKGGCCSVCGYNRCVNALDFHHIDKKQKDFTVGSNFSYSKERIKAELRKCVILCSNCHREYHNGFITLDGLIITPK